MAYTVAAVMVRLGLGPLVDRTSRRRVALASLAVYGAVVIAMGQLVPGTLPFFGAGLGLAHGLFYPALNAVAVEGKRAHERGKVMALFQAAFSLGFAGGPLPLGMLAERSGYPTMFLVAGTCALGALALLALSPEGRARDT